MKRSTATNRSRFSMTKWIMISIVAIIVIAFVTATAWMQGRENERNREASPLVQERANAQLEKALFVDEDQERAERAGAAEQQASVSQPAQPNGEVMSYDLPKIVPSVYSGDVRNLPQVPQSMLGEREPEEPFNAERAETGARSPQRADVNVPLAPMPAPSQSFPGLNRTDTCTGGPCGAGIPPDTNGDVGPNHYIQSVNSSFGIYNKTGTLLASFTENSLFSAGPTGTICDTNSAGDPVVMYDSMADRWILSNLAFAFNAGGTSPIAPYYECLAVSKTSDPVAGGWYLYPIRTDTGISGQPPLGTLNDYPKFGIWNDCLYYTANGFINAASFNGVEFGSFSRADMYAGAALTGSLGFIAGGTNFALLPANLSAPASGLPPAGSAAYFVAESATAFSYDVRKFTPGAHCGGGGVMGAAVNVTQPAYSVPAANIVPQPNDAGSLHNLDSLGDRLMSKAQYRNVAGVESIWVTHTFRVTSTTQTGSQWAQLNVTGGTVAAAPVQQQFYDPADGIYRWMSSIAADKDGNVALGYSTSNGTSPNFPSIAYSGRLAGDALNQLPQTETQLVAGAGSELNTCGGAACHRWGDYSSMSVDPSDSCTFWFTSEYYTDQTNGTAGSWNTRIGSFKFPACAAAASGPTVPNAPTSLSFTGVGATSMTLNWLDNATNEDGYAIYRSTDNLNFVFAAQTAANAVSGNVTGLNPSTNYFFKVYATLNGQLSTALSGSQATTAPGVATSTAAGGLWSQTTTWSSGVVPTTSDNVTIADGATVTIDIAAVALNVTVGTGGAAATLQFIDTSAQSLTVTQNVTVAANGVFQSATTGTVTTHALSVGGNLTNNGILDFSTAANLAGANITFTGAANNTFGGTGGTTDIRGLTINKGNSFASILEMNPTNFTVQGTSVDGAPMAFLTLTNGTLKISGTFALTGRVFTAAGYSIPATGGFWLNNPNFVVAAQNGTGTVNGLFRMSQGTFNLGTAAGSAVAFAAGSTGIVEGGAINSSGRFAITASTNSINYTQSGGTITVCTVGNTSTTLASFDLGTSLASNINMTGGTIVVQLANTAVSGPRDYRMQSGAGTLNVTGGTVQLGNAASGPAKAFNIAGVFPNLVLTNTSANHTATMLAPAVYNNISRNITINTGTTLNLGNQTFLMNGTTVTNNGTLTHNGASSSFTWLLTTAPVSYTGTGVVTAPMTSFNVQADQGLTIDPASPNIPVAALRMFTGNIINANKITLGNGGATTGIVQIGNTTTPTNAGTLDVAPTFNLGTGGEVISYLRTTLTRSTGPEINPARTLTTFTYDDNDATHALTMVGGDLTVTGVTTLTNGRVITGANTFIVGSAGTLTRTNGYIDGNLRKVYAAAGSKTFEVGTANAYSPVTVNATAGTFPADFTAKAVQGPQPNVSAATSIQRYWTLTEGGSITANLTFSYIDPTDIVGNEANYRVIRVSGGTPVSFINNCPTPPANFGCVDTTANTGVVNGVTEFSDWTIGENLAPTAAPATISGRVTTADGSPLAGVTMNLSGGRTGKVITDANGNYSFTGVNTDSFYTVTPAILNYHFSPSDLSFSLLANKTDAVFTATRDATIIGNVIDTPDYFVRQHYLDFLGREPDESGFNFWSNEILACGGDAGCAERRAINVSAAYFLSIEFQETGVLVDGLYRASYDRRPQYAEFLPDTAAVARNVIVGQGNWAQTLVANKQAFVDAWVSRPEFRSAYDGLSNAGYVDALLAHSSGFNGDRTALVNGLNSGALTRAAALRQIAENDGFASAKRNAAFVMMEYFGYLRRDPDEAGYNFWLQKLNQHNGNFEQAEMVKSFIVSGEYRARFSN